MVTILFLTIGILIVIGILTLISFFKTAVLMAILLPVMIIYWFMDNTPTHYRSHHED